jgi:hypothetical protein
VRARRCATPGFRVLGFRVRLGLKTLQPSTLGARACAQVRDAAFRNKMLSAICRVGNDIEVALGSAQVGREPWAPCAAA